MCLKFIAKIKKQYFKNTTGVFFIIIFFISYIMLRKVFDDRYWHIIFKFAVKMSGN